MITHNRQCSECKSEMMLDHVKVKDGKTTMYYACVNPNCTQQGKAFTPTGKESESQIKKRG